MSEKRWARLASAAGYTATEAMTVVACMGVVAAFAAPNIIRMKAALEVQDATAQVGGALQRTRARAVSEATPYLFLVQKEEVGDGSRGAFALIVRDTDRSYSLTAPDTVETFSLENSLRPEVRQFGGNPDVEPRTDIPPAYTDASKLIADALATEASQSASSGSGSSGSGSSGSGSGSSGSGSGSSGSGSGGLLGGVGEIVGGLLGGGSSGSGSSGSGSSGSGSQGTTTASTTRDSAGSLSDSVENGSTFPVSEEEGVPGVAFNERGIPVSLDSPNDWGTGAGAIYMTDDKGSLYASVLSPLGEVSISHYDAGSGSWK